MCAARVGGKVAALRTVGEARRGPAGPRRSEFPVLVSKADGSTEVKTLTQLGITEINLKAGCDQRAEWC